MAVELEKWTGGDASSRAIEPEARAIQAAINSMESERSSTLTISMGERSLIISASRGEYAATALLGGDNFYDLLGDSAAMGSREFIQGGQLIEMPSRHLVSLQAAVMAALEFVQSGTIRMGIQWERQLTMPE